MHFRHADEIWRDYPELAAGVVVVDGITADARVGAAIAEFSAVAQSRLATGPESELPAIQAWRRAFARMGLKPTQYRCAAEALLRRYRKDTSLPQIHPLIDLCNVISLAFAIPVAVLDRAKIAGYVEVRYATGSESYLPFSGEPERPEPHEVIYADDEGRAHARRWTNRQSGYSAVREETTDALIVAEAMHAAAPADISRLVDAVADNLTAAWSASVKTAMPTSAAPYVEFDG
jgi:DNA/RNA-binding domain of Phe-tRNA-synthetase-like protein